MPVVRPRRPLLAIALAGVAFAAASPVPTVSAAEWRAPAAGPASDRATPRIVGGSVLRDPAEAPWAVAIQTVFAKDAVGGCSGTVLDPVHVLTAAHCFVANDGRRATPDQVAVAAGTADVTTPAGIASGVIEDVRTIRIHPRHRPGGFFDDVAVLTLATPLDLSTGRIAALPLVPAGTFVGPGRTVRIFGFGITGAGASDYGTLRAVSVRSVIGGSRCGNTAPGAFVCTQGAEKGACSGDSGGTATIGTGAARRVIGVTDIADGGCSGLNFFATVGAPEIRTFIDAALAEQDLTAAQTPLAPRGRKAVTLVGTARAGRTVSCRRGPWTAGTRFRYAFLLQRGSRQRNRGFRASRTYRLRTEDRGWSVFCAVEVRSAGGRGVAVARNTRRVR